MGDTNAWDMAEQSDKKRSRSPSKASRVESELLLPIDDAELQALGLASKEQIVEAANKEIVEEKKRRSKSRSPALDSLRRVTRTALEKVGVIMKKRDDAIPCMKATEIESLPLDDYCKRPIEFFQEPKPFFFHDFGVSKLHQKDEPERCAYLFRGSSFEDDNEELTKQEKKLEYDSYCPVHGSRRRLNRRRLVTMQSIMSSVDQDDHEAELAILCSQEFVAKLIRKRKRELLTGREKMKVQKVMQKIEHNLWIISLSFLFLFTAFHGLQNLQTSINNEMGSDCLAVLYISLALSSVVIPPFMINRLGCKLTIIASMFIYVLYLFINFRPSYYSLVPASILCGAAASSLWGAKCVYITEMGIRFAKLNIEAQNTVIVRFFGYFFMVHHCGQVVGNLISSYILTAAMKRDQPLDEIYETCGHAFPSNLSGLSHIATNNLQRPPQSAYVSVILTYIGCAIVAVMIVAMFLNALHRDVISRNKAPSFNPELLKLTLKNFSSIQSMLLVPLTLFNGFEQAFIVAVFSKAYVACGLGISQLGFVLAAFGLADAICSIVFGPLIKLFGRMPLFVFGAVVNLLMIATLMIWPVNPADEAIFYVVACVWGMADGVWNTQINGFWIALVGKESLHFAFTTYRLWESVGMAMAMLLIRVLSVEQFLYCLFVLLLVGMCGYVLIEMYDEVELYYKHMFGVCSRKRKEDEENETEQFGISMEQSLISDLAMHKSYI
ncbi:hypothetical protein WR25_19034 [Diploscapter pachys]|uniref:Potassium channel regulatory protein unc-93 n=1 Tax=Diploscapter pachys TaxID=2018661 RepID=A0A2A2JJQ6_9BILA|nr:hypothetical protein WR25_19034 [Diploscapter pachys]